MKHCPYGGASHKEFYVRLSPGIVQCLHSQCGKLFESRCPDKELAFWKHPLTEQPDEQGINIDNGVGLLGDGTYAGIDRLPRAAIAVEPGQIINYNPAERLIRAGLINNPDDLMAQMPPGEMPVRDLGLRERMARYQWPENMTTTAMNITTGGTNGDPGPTQAP